MAPVPGDSPKTPAWHVDAARGPSTPSLDHLVGAGEQRRWNFEAQRLRGCQIDDEIELRRLLDRKVARLCPAQNLVDVVSGAPEHVWDVCSIGHQTAPFDPFPKH